MEIIGTILMTISTVALAIIGWRQYKITRLQIKSTLYPKRLAIYRHTIAFMNSNLCDLSDESLHAFWDAVGDESRFVLDPKVVQHLERIYDKANRLLELQRNSRSKSGEPVEPEILDLRRWFSAEKNLIHEQFERYLRFKRRDSA